MRVLTILFDGLCCHIKPPNGRPPVSRRTILVDGSHHNHLAYVEFYPSDFVAERNPNESPIPYTRDNVGYCRIDVTNSRIALRNKILSTGFTVLPSFEQSIPKLSEVCPSFKEVKPQFLTPVIPTNTVAAYFDMSAGTLSSGPVESKPTEFVPQNKWPKRRLGQWAQLEVEIDGAAPTLVITDLATGKDRIVEFEDGTDLLTIGNQVLSDILGKPVSGPRDGHFDMFYDLAVHVDERPQPKGGGLGLGTGCTNTGYP